MKICLTFLLVIIQSVTLFGQNAYYTKHWSRVYKHELKDLPKSALSIVDSIYLTAKRDKNISQLTKALVYQSKFALTLREDAELLITKKIQNEILESKAPLRNILESVLSNIYWEYFRQNRWKYYERSRTSPAKKGEDFRLWDSESMFSEIHNHYQLSLQNSQLLKSISLSTIDEIITQVENSKMYRPSLFDFLAHNALDFYETGESLNLKPRLNFEIKDSRYFDDFANIQLTSLDSLSPTYHALIIYKALNIFHKGDKDPSAFLSNEIDRLQFVVDKGIFDNGQELHKTALEKLKTLFARYPASTLLDFQLASIVDSEGKGFNPKTNRVNQFKRRDALTICKEAISAFPASDGANQCKILLEEILSQHLEVTTEEFLPINKPSRLLVAYKNIDSLQFYAYQVSKDFEQRFNRAMNDSARLANLASMKYEFRWHSSLSNLMDYQEHTTEIVVPKLPGGRFLVVARVKKDAISGELLFAYSSIQVTNLVLVETNLEQKSRYQVADRNTGAPVSGAVVIFKNQKQNGRNDSIVNVLTTDGNGFCEFEKRKNETYNLNATVAYRGDSCTFGNYYVYQYNYDRQKNKVFDAKAFLFTDRSIYRPSQSVYFKGILIKTQNGKSSTVSGQYVEVILQDVNYEDVGSLRLKTNSFGSFSGEFKLPSTGLTGEYTLTADEDFEDDSRFYDKLDNFFTGEISIAVEEYKRPTFEVVFSPLKDPSKLNDSIQIRGTATSFSGAKISGGKVSFNVKRNVRYPNWRYWNSSGTFSGEQEIQNGEMTTNSNGEFVIKFKAIPDEKISSKELPVFLFEVVADVTDINGETRSSTTSVRVGYQSITASINSPTLVNRQILEHTISITTENLNSQPVPAKGSISIYKVKSSSTAKRPRQWPAPDVHQISRSDFDALFPNDTYNDTEPDEAGNLAAALPFNTSISNEIKFRVEKEWDLGSYLVVLNTIDESGDSVVAKSKFELFDLKSNFVTDGKMLSVEADKPKYKVGEIAKIKIKSASSDMSVVIDIERDNKIIKTYLRHLTGKSTEIQIPITEAAADGLMIHYYGTNANSFFHGKNRIVVGKEKDLMNIETITFKDKLQPGEEQTWSFAITGEEEQRKGAEILASMYDASLDQFRPHAWTFDPIERSYSNSSTRISFDQSFGVRPFTVAGERFHYYYQPRLHFDQFDNFGFSITNSKSIKQRYFDRIYSIANDSLNVSKISESNNKKLRKGFVSGRITSDEDGSPIPGVNVLIKGTNIGTVTDSDGSYMLQADRGDEIVFSFIGYSTAQAKVGRKNVLNVSMATDVKQLTEVVVTALGVEKTQYALGYSVTSVKSVPENEEIVFDQLLNGQVAGVQINGLPGGAARLMIRGASNLDGSSNPLYVVDGQIVESSKIDSGDIESMQVLKGEAATALYGSRASNGVIIITTKSGQKKIDEELAKVNARKNFNETAFFFPHLSTDETGKVKFTFTTPESLTRWKLQLLAHNKELQSVTKTLSAVTQKDFMVAPNAPRFFRVDDEIIFSTKIINLTGNELQGNIALQLTDAISGKPVDELFGNRSRNLTFQLKPNGNSQVSWKLKIPSGIDAVQYKVVASTGNFSDGEQNALPVLSNRILVTETMPMFIRAGEPQSFVLNKLKSNSSNSLQNHLLTLEVTSNPAWFAVEALPYLMEFPYECSEQMFSRYYANTLASHIANTNPKIREVFDKWASSGGLLSNLEKNPELKSIIIQETPWLRDAQSETEQRKRLALLFDLNMMKSQRQVAVDKLLQLQLNDGGFTWFSGGRYSSRFITQHIVSGYGHLKALKMVNEKDKLAPAVVKAIGFMDTEILKDYNRLLERVSSIRVQAKTSKEGDQMAKEFLDRQQVGNDQIHYLYSRSSFADIKVPGNVMPAVEYYQKQTARYWQNFNLYLKGMSALIQYRNENKALANDILKSLKENSIIGNETGMYWKENKAGWSWNEAPVETQSLLIEAFAEIESKDSTISVPDRLKTIDDLQIWLLRNKRTSQWETTKATTEAIYALLLHGTDWLSIDDEVEVSVAGKPLTLGSKSNVEAGTGYFKTSWTGNLIRPEMSEVKLAKKGNGTAWAGLYWQYFEDLDKITTAETPLKLSKKIFMVTRTDKGELLTEIQPGQPVAIGSLVRIRLELKADQDMEFLHMKDMRAAGLEPVDVLSEYKWNDGLGYYQSTKDASTNFFFDFVPKGVYVFEYDLRVNNKGDFSNGITTIQSMYAPEFSSHSQGTRVKVD